MSDQHHDGDHQDGHHDHLAGHLITEMIAGHGSHKPNEPGSQKWRNAARLLAAFALVVAAGFGVVGQQLGNAVFSFVGAVLLFLSIVPDDVFTYPRTIAGFVVNTTLLEIYRRTVRLTRGLFQYGDAFVRGVVIFLAIGGMATVCKYGIKNFSMLPDYVDLAFKRLGPGVAVASLVVFPASLISKRIFTLSMHTYDFVIRQYEFRFYVSVIFFSLTVLYLSAEIPLESVLPLREGQGKKPDFKLPSDFRVVGSIALIWLIWVLGTGACIISRFYEWNWRDRVTSYLGPARLG